MLWFTKSTMFYSTTHCWDHGAVAHPWSQLSDKKVTERWRRQGEIPPDVINSSRNTPISSVLSVFKHHCSLYLYICFAWVWLPVFICICMTVPALFKWLLQTSYLRYTLFDTKNPFLHNETRCCCSCWWQSWWEATHNLSHIQPQSAGRLWQKKKPLKLYEVWKKVIRVSD